MSSIWEVLMNPDTTLDDLDMLLSNRALYAWTTNQESDGNDAFMEYLVNDTETVYQIFAFKNDIVESEEPVVVGVKRERE